MPLHDNGVKRPSLAKQTISSSRRAGRKKPAAKNTEGRAHTAISNEVLRPGGSPLRPLAGILRKPGSIANSVGKRAMEKTLCGEVQTRDFPCAWKIPQKRQDFHFFHSPDYGELTSDFTAARSPAGPRQGDGAQTRTTRSPSTRRPCWPESLCFVN